MRARIIKGKEPIISTFIECHENTFDTLSDWPY